MGDTWERELPSLVGRTVDGIRIDFSLSMTFLGEPTAAKDSITVTIAGPFTYSDEAGARYSLGPLDGEYDRADLGPVLRVFGRQIAAASISATCVLRLKFTGGSALVVDPADDPHYEPWQIWGPGSSELICAPGGAYLAEQL